MPLVLRLLGRFELAAGSGDALKVTGARAQLLLARLALAGGERLDRQTLSALLWGGRGDAQARASLRQMIWTLRQALDPFPGALVVDGDFIWLDPKAIGNDVAEFDRLALSSVLGDLEAALALYRGELLEGVDVIALDPDGYFQHQRTRLQDLALRVARSLVEAYGQKRQWEDAVRVARRGLVLDPYDETLHARLFDGLQKLGRPREARDQDDAFRTLMWSELGVTVTARGIADPLPRPTAPAYPGAAPAAPTPTGPTIPPRRRARQIVVGVAAAALLLALAAGIWRFEDPGPAARIPTRNLEAYDQYLRAEDLHLSSSDADQLGHILALYRRAIELDPDFAEAHAGYARAAVEVWHGGFTSIMPEISARNTAYQAAGRALELDPDNARALVVLSRIQAQDGARDSALASAERAVAAQPNDAEARANLALILSLDGQAFKARAELTRLRQLDPVPRPEWLLIFGEIAFADGRYNNAIADLVAAWPDLPNNPVLLAHLTSALAIQGQLVQAQMVRDKLLARWPEANLYLLLEHYSPLRGAEQNQRLLDGLRRAGLPVWPQGVRLVAADRVTGTDLAALLGDVPGSSDQYLRGDELCRIEQSHSVCGAIFRAPPGLKVSHVFVAPTELRFFSLPK